MSQFALVRRSASMMMAGRSSRKRRFCGRFLHVLSTSSPTSSSQCPGQFPTNSIEKCSWSTNFPTDYATRWLSSSSEEGSTTDNADNDDDQKQSNAPTERQKRSKRRTASQSIPQWLRSEPFCFDRTVSALNLNLSSDRFKTGSSFTALSGLSEQYRKVFVDSIPSFTDYLKTSDNLPDELERALDRLVDAGFDDADFARTFRNLKSKEIVHAQTTFQLLEKEKKYEERQRFIKLVKEEIEEMKEVQLAELRASHDKLRGMIIENEDKGNEETNPMLAAISSAANMAAKSKDKLNDSFLSVEAAKREKNLLEHRIAKLERRIEAREAHVASVEEGAQNLLESIQDLQQQQAEARSSMTHEVFSETQSTVNETLLTICDFLADHIQQRHSSLIERYQNLDAKTDLTKPHEWYMLARLDKRKIIYHGGPTNSGKTYTALQRLKAAKTGLYVGPLRLLAAEIYELLNAQGVYTSLLTGQERTEFAFCTHIAATVEMAGNLLEKEFDVVVIDEIQMIEDEDRGFAWTRALLGLRCKEIHVCGGMEAKELVEQLAESCNDDFELNQYERFSKLTVEQTSLASQPDEMGAYKSVRPGDCIVAFSRNDIFAIQREVEKATNFKACIIYGSLPPEVRIAQAQNFNNPESGFDILIASDAISMGLNLNIRRIIFNNIFKNDGDAIIRLGHSAVKQIAGRAGRRNSPFPEGEVTCRDPRDLQYITDCLATEIAPVEKAGLIPTAAHVDLFGEALQQYHYGRTENDDGEAVTPHLHTLLKEFSDMAVIKGYFFLCRQKDMETVAKWLKEVELETDDKYMFCMAPVTTSNPNQKAILLKFAQKIAAGEVPGLTRGGAIKRARTFLDLARLCSIFSEVELFIWLQNKFPPVNFMEQQAALTRKDRTSSMIKLGLNEAQKLTLDHCYVSRDAMLRTAWSREQDKSEDAVSSDGSETEDEESKAHSFA